MISLIHEFCWGLVLSDCRGIRQSNARLNTGSMCFSFIVILFYCYYVLLLGVGYRLGKAGNKGN